MFKSIYNIFEKLVSEKDHLTRQCQELLDMRELAASEQAHPLTIRAIDFEIEYVKSSLEELELLCRTTCVSRGRHIVTEVRGGQC
jgi:hypothetical protein